MGPYIVVLEGEGCNWTYVVYDSSVNFGCELGFRTKSFASKEKAYAFAALKNVEWDLEKTSTRKIKKKGGRCV